MSGNLNKNSAKISLVNRKNELKSIRAAVKNSETFFILKTRKIHNVRWFETQISSLYTIVAFRIRLHKRLIWFRVNLHFSMVFILRASTGTEKVRTKESRKFQLSSVPSSWALIFLSTQQIETWNEKIWTEIQLRFIYSHLSHVYWARV